jgi:DNA-binding transcriptional LysR family regulator
MLLAHLETFNCVVQAGSMSEAARRMHYSQPTVTSHVASLEKELGVPLLTRTPDGVVPTAPGSTLVLYVEKILELLANAREGVAERRDDSARHRSADGRPSALPAEVERPLVPPMGNEAVNH